MLKQPAGKCAKTAESSDPKMASVQIGIIVTYFCTVLVRFFFSVLCVRMLISGAGLSAELGHIEKGSTTTTLLHAKVRAIVRNSARRNRALPPYSLFNFCSTVMSVNVDFVW